MYYISHVSKKHSQETQKQLSYLFLSHASVAHLEHVEIIPAARESAVNVRGNLVDDGKDRAVRSWCNTCRVRGICTRAKIIRTRERVVDVS